tara:strand:- start:70 stop:1839 length:1770 start_codon:yes stop_codon:yes gene_type:complete
MLFNKKDINKFKKLFEFVILRNKLLFLGLIFFSIIAETAAVSVDLIIAKVLESFANYSLTSDLSLFNESITNILLILIIVIILSAVSFWMEPIMVAKIVGNTEPYIKKKLLKRLLFLDTKDILNKKTGALVNKVNRTSKSLENFLYNWRFSLAPFIVGMPTVLILLTSINYKFLILNLLYLSILIPVSLRYQRMGSKMWEKVYPKYDRSTGILNDILVNILPVKINSQEKYSVKIYSKSMKFIPKFWLKVSKIYSRWGSSTSALNFLFLGFTIYLGFDLFIKNLISIDQLALTFLLFNRTDRYIGYFVHAIGETYNRLAEFDAGMKILEEKATIIDDLDAKEIKVNKGKIEFNDVTFSYENKKVFDKFKFLINPGETIGVVGKSGAGKTTLANLLFRLYDIDKGYISIDGQNIRHVTQNSLRNSISLVPQDTLLFDDTIYNNILFSNPNSNRREVLKAIKEAELSEFINSLPNKEKTIVGERGVKLSGGQRQRISIARAILANKKIIVLDEATSALDSETELKIRDTLDRITKGRTTITIAHRLSTVMNSDKIVVFDEGKIVEVGDHKSLLKKKGKYAELWKYQTKGYL